MKIEARFTHDRVRHDQENNTHLALTLKAPRKDWEADRAPVCLMPVIDVSGSMSGDKLHYAKQSAMKLVEHLRPGDFAGLAVFTTTATLISPPVEMTQDKKDELRGKIGSMRSQSSTNFGAGMLMGLKEVNKADLPAKMLYRVIMLTDGLANVDVKGRALIPLLEANRGRATLSAFGYGSDADQELLGDLAVKGDGNYAFIENPDDAMGAFAKELGGLLATYARDIRVKLELANGHTIEKVVSDVDVEGDEKKAEIRLPDIISEEERHLVVALKLSKQTKALPRKTNVATIKVSYDLIGKDSKVETETKEVKAKIQFVKAGKEQEKPTEEVMKVVAQAQLVQAQIEAEEHANRGDYKGAVEICRGVARDFEAAGAQGAAAHARVLGDKMGSASVYVANTGYLMSNKKGLSRGVGTSGMSAGLHDDLRCYHGLDPEVEAQQIMKAQFEVDQAVRKLGMDPADAVNQQADGSLGAALAAKGISFHGSAGSSPVEAAKPGIGKSRSQRW